MRDARSGPGRRPVVTIITPTFNHEAFVGEALRSAIAQTYSAWELVVVDDGSTDRTVSIVRSFDDPRITLVKRPHRGLSGLGEAYRAALDASSGSLVAVLEGDDRWPETKLEIQVPDFTDPQVVLSYGTAGLIDDRGCMFGLAEPAIAPAVRDNDPPGSILPSLTEGNPIVSPTVVVRRAALERIGGFWQPPGVPYLDHPTWLKLALEGRFRHHAEVCGYWRRHPAQYTSTSVDAADAADPSGYVMAIIEGAGPARGEPGPSNTAMDIRRRNADRVLLNRWRLTLLSGDSRSVLATFGRLIGTRRARFVAAACAGLGSWVLGSDLEWAQRRRRRIGWPSRAHLRSRAHRDRGRRAPAGKT